MQYSAQGVAQALRMLSRTQQADLGIVVLEGASDVRALRPYFNAGVRLFPAGSKSLVLGARRALRDAEIGRFLFIVDCDNDNEVPEKGNVDFIITSYRDLEGDLCFYLDAAERVAYEYLPVSQTACEVDLELGEILRTAVDVSCKFSCVKDAARRRRLRLKKRDERTGRARRLGLEDMPPLAEWCDQSGAPSLATIVATVADLLEWKPVDLSAVMEDSAADWLRRCEVHHLSACTECQRKSLCNGHDLEAAMAASISRWTGRHVDVDEVQRGIRMTSNTMKSSEWPLIARVQRYESATGLRILK